MCLQCHLGFSKDEIVEQFKNPQFEKWNDCSLSHLIISGTGYDGIEARKLALNLFDQYLKYRQLGGDKGLVFISLDNLEKTYNKLKDLSPEQLVPER